MSKRKEQRGAPAPLPHCGADGLGLAAMRAAQRGAPAPLPHCGPTENAKYVSVGVATRGAGAPPSLRRLRPGAGGRLDRPNEGRRRPSLIAAVALFVLRHRLHPNEGRRRPSLIAASGRTSIWPVAAIQRGAPAPLPHCGEQTPHNFGKRGRQRGAPAPLPHCGAKGDSRRRYASPNEGRRRPSLIAALVVAGRPAFRRPQRGAPAPLPHCGMPLGRVTNAGFIATRGAGAPPSLRLLSPLLRSENTADNEGRRRPSLIAAQARTPAGVEISSNEGRRRPSLIAAFACVRNTTR